MNDSVVETFVSVVAAVEEAGLRYVVMGGLALNAWAVPRATFDIDLGILDDARPIDPLLARLEAAGVRVPAERRQGTVQRFGAFRTIEARFEAAGAREIPVDLFLMSSPFEQSAFARRVRIEALDRSLWVLSAADLLLYKLVAWRRKDRMDVQNLLAVQGIPEPFYTWPWAKRLAVAPRLQQAIGEAGLAT